MSSQAFKPTKKDDGKLSVYDGDQATAEHSWEHFTSVLGLSSIGVQSVTVGECNELELPAVPDPEEFPEHVAIRFTGLSKSQVEKRAKQLREVAATRGWQFRCEAHE